MCRIDHFAQVFCHREGKCLGAGWSVKGRSPNATWETEENAEGKAEGQDAHSWGWWAWEGQSQARPSLHRKENPQALIVTYKKSTHLGIHSEKILSRSTRRLCEVVHQGVLRLQGIETLSEAVTWICQLYSVGHQAPVKKQWDACTYKIIRDILVS